VLQQVSLVAKNDALWHLRNRQRLLLAHIFDEILGIEKSIMRVLPGKVRKGHHPFSL
jgi:hypothetical protein